MKKRLIDPVKDNMDKQRTYAEQLERYKRAISEEFYFEAMLIDYAMLEDRLLAFLYHIAFTERRETKVWKLTQEQFQKIVTDYKGKKETDSLDIKNISGKTKVLRCVLRWAGETAGGYQSDWFLPSLKRQCEGADIGGLIETLKQIDDWCAYRNEVIHALLNKNVDSLQKNLKENAECGMRLARYIDSQVRLLKADGSSRRAVQ